MSQVIKNRNERLRVVTKVDDDKQESLQPSQTRYISLLSLIRGALTMHGRTTKGDPVNLKIHPAVLSVITVCLLAFLSFAGWLIRTVGRVDDSVGRFVEQEQNTQAYILAETNRINFMIGLMTRDQQAQVMQFDLTHPLPKRPGEKPKGEREN